MSWVEKKIKGILAEKNISFEEFEHEAVYTCEQAAVVRGLPSAREGVKCLIFGTDLGKFILVLNPGDKKIDAKKIAKLEKAGRLFLATPEKVEKLAGVPIGCVAPFGLKTRLKIYLNQELLENEYIYFNPGSHTKTIKMKSSDLLKVLEDPVRF